MLFLRTWAVTVGTLRVSAPMRAAFEIDRSTKHAVNTARVRLWNLTRSHQTQIEQAAAAQVLVEAGYAGERGPQALFSGELFRARGLGRTGAHTQDAGEDSVTHVEARDGGRAYAQARISAAFGAGVRVETVVRACARALGVGEGNLVEVSAAARLATGDDTYPEGTVISGQVSRELTRVLRGMGLGWSIQHNALQILRNGFPLSTQAVRLAVDTGLVGEPEIGTRGHVKATSLLGPDLWPGRVVVLSSRRANGAYTVEAVKFRGDSHAQEWFADLDLVPEAA